MNNLVEKYIVVEILEKIFRIKKFIYSNNSLIRDSSNKITVEVFENALNKILGNLELPIKALNNKTISTAERIAINRRLSNIFYIIKGFHSKLKYIHSDWVKSETYTFTNRLIKNLAEQESLLKINIVLSNEYSFKENNLVNKFNEVFQQSQTIFTNKDFHCPTLFLPKIEFSNPLNWAILAHEIGHLNESEVKTFTDISEIDGTLNVKNREILRRWAEEIYCDIFALNILGPSYFVSFVSFALVTTGLGGNCKSSFTHPSNMLRIRFLHEYLNRNEFNIELESNLFGKIEINNFFYRMIEDFDKVDRILLETSIPNDVEIEELTNFFDLIREKSKKISTVSNVDANELKIISSLKDRLKRGIPIGSYHDKDYVEINKLLEEKKEFSLIKNLVSERGTSIREILNAGWINKVSNHFPMIIETLFERDVFDIKESIFFMEKFINESDDRLLNSIEVSELFELIEND
jgi:hypothetical protein